MSSSTAHTTTSKGVQLVRKMSKRVDELTKPQEQEAPRHVSKTLKTVGGMAGGFVEACALQPLDTGKILIRLLLMKG